MSVSDVAICTYSCDYITSYCRALVAFISYFVIGAIILRVRYQKSGSDLIINKEFWKDFPILVKVCAYIHTY